MQYYDSKIIVTHFLYFRLLFINHTLFLFILNYQNSINTENNIIISIIEHFEKL